MTQRASRDRIVHLNPESHKALKEMARRKGVHMTDLLGKIIAKACEDEIKENKKRIAMMGTSVHNCCKICKGKLSPVRAFGINDTKPLCRDCYWKLKTNQQNRVLKIG